MLSNLVRSIVAAALVLPLLAAVAPAAAEAPANAYFLRTWARHDQVVADLVVSRTWMWGPEGFTGRLNERYDEAEGGRREVQYFDKSRMEITADPSVPPESVWYVTNGLLVVEMVTGRLQVGDNSFEPQGAAQVNVAGDPDDTTGPTYATFAGLLDLSAAGSTSAITSVVNRAGTVSQDSRLASYAIGTTSFVPETRHWIAVPFWEFMTSRGLVSVDGNVTEAPMFENPFYATGFPIAEPYWARVKVAGATQDVLVQCFERRCLTYTPGNAAGWEVEAGNVGQHYFRWRYEQLEEVPELTGKQLAFSRGIAAPGTAGGELLVTEADASGVEPIMGAMSVWPASWSPDGQWLAFASADAGHYDVYLSNHAGTDLRRMTYTLGDDDHPVWSPAGNELAFISDNDGDVDIYRMDWTGENLTQLTNTAANEGEIAWSPDGSKIAYTTYTDQGSPITIMSRTGQLLYTVTDCHGGGMNVGLTWSPDGAMLAFSSSASPSGKSTYLCVVDANGRNPRDLAFSATGDAGQPTWSPDSRRLAYAWRDPDAADPSYQIRVVDADGTDDRALVATAAEERAPNWSPDGKWIAYQSDANGSDDIWVVKLSDASTHQITSGPEDDTNPVWRP